MNMPSFRVSPLRNLCGVFVILLLVGLVSRPASAVRSSGGAIEDVDRAAIEALAGEILARVDAADALRSRVAEAEIALKRAQSAADTAAKAREIAEIAVKEYLEGSAPLRRAEISGAIKLAESELERAKDRLTWSEGMFRRGSVSEDQVMADRLNVRKCEIGVLNEKKKQTVFDEFTSKRDVTNLEADVKRALSKELQERSAVFQAEDAGRKLSRLLAEAELSEAESRALALLAEAIRGFDSGKPAPARAKLDEARAVWRGEVTRRADLRFEAMKARVRRAAAEKGAAR